MSDQPIRLKPRPGDHTADHRLYLLALAAVPIGLCATAGAWCLLQLIALSSHLFWTGRPGTTPLSLPAVADAPAVFVVPLLGSLIIGLMARFGSEKIRGHGIPEAIEAILYGESRLSLKVAILKPLSAAISIGSGGPFGAEGPIIMTGGAVGSLLGQRLVLSHAERKTLLVAGAVAGMTAIFGTPLAAVLLALEVLLFEWKPRSLIPVALACLTAMMLRPYAIGAAPLFPFHPSGPVAGTAIPLAMLVGLLVGLLAVLLSTLLYRLEDGFHRLPVHWMWWPALAAIVVGFGGWLDPRALGAGYDSIQALQDGRLDTHAITLLLLVKAGIWLIALASGTSGGVLAPLLLIGGALGALIGHLLPGVNAPWVLLGMSASLSAAMRAPLTATLFAAEVSGDYQALPLLLAASGMAYGLSVLLMRRSILTEKISRRGRHIVQEYSVDPADLQRAETVMQRSVPTATLDAPWPAGADQATVILDREGRPLAVAEPPLQRPAIAQSRIGTEDLKKLSSITVSGPEVSVKTLALLMLGQGTRYGVIVDPAAGDVLGLVHAHDLPRVWADYQAAEAVPV